MSTLHERPGTARGAWERWQEAARDPGTSGVLDLVRHVVASGAGDSILVRALAVVPVYVDLAGGEVATSWAGGERFVHVWSTPVRLTTSKGPAATEISLTELRLPDLVDRLAPGVGVRVDPGLESELVVPPRLVEDVVLTARGAPTTAALTPVEGEELRVERGPEELTDLDEAVLEATRAIAPDAVVTRACATLDGIGGRVWPVYVVAGAHAGADALDVAIRDAAYPARPLTLVDGEPSRLADHLAIGDVAVPLASLTPVRRGPVFRPDDVIGRR